MVAKLGALQKLQIDETEHLRSYFKCADSKLIVSIHSWQKVNRLVHMVSETIMMLCLLHPYVQFQIMVLFTSSIDYSSTFGTQKSQCFLL